MSDPLPPVFAYRPPPELTAAGRRHVPVVVVGAGPVGLAAAIDLGLNGIETLLLDDQDTLSQGSRAICWSKRTLEILERLGVAGRLTAKGVTWETGRVFVGANELYRFDLADDGVSQHPAFINLQQYYAEEFMVERLRTLAAVDLRWRNRVVGAKPAPDGVTLDIDTPDGRYAITADYVIAADGAKSTLRHLLGLEFKGRVFEDRFLIADVRMRAAFPRERWFWFDPPFNPGQSALLHMQADDVWRIDLQLGRDADPERERRFENVIPRLKRMLGPTVPFDLVWTSVYTFQCRRLDRFRHGRVMFAGDSAHQVSPFGARGANGGIQDADNLVWKLALVLAGKAEDGLLDSYDAERIAAADENILNSTRSTDFITPKTAASRALRDATLALARDWPFARALVNSGRLSRPSRYQGSPLNGPADIANAIAPGTLCPNAPLTLHQGSRARPVWLLDLLGGGFALLCLGGVAPAHLDRLAVPLTAVIVAPVSPSPDGRWLEDTEGRLPRLYGGAGAYLVRPDQHVAAHWRSADPTAIDQALRRMLAPIPSMNVLEQGAGHGR